MVGPSNPASGPLASCSKAVQWFLLLAVSLLFAGCLRLAQLPAALLIGPMLAAILAGSNGATLRVWRPAFAGAQAFVGVLIAASLSPKIFSSLLAGWPLFLAAVLATVAASSFLGYLISRWKV